MGLHLRAEVLLQLPSALLRSKMCWYPKVTAVGSALSLCRPHAPERSCLKFRRSRDLSNSCEWEPAATITGVYSRLFEATRVVSPRGRKTLEPPARTSSFRCSAVAKVKGASLWCSRVYASTNREPGKVDSRHGLGELAASQTHDAWTSCSTVDFLAHGEDDAREPTKLNPHAVLFCFPIFLPVIAQTMDSVGVVMVGTRLRHWRFGWDRLEVMVLSGVNRGTWGG